jgi:ATP-binding cassette subfamily F protein 3
VLRIEDLRLGYGERVLLDEAAMHLTYGERAVLLGPNGAGKTSLLRVIAGQNEPPLLAGMDWGGTVRLGRGVRLGYMPQEGEGLDEHATPVGLVRAAAPLDETEARSFLHYFLFAGDDVFVSVGRLSWGERKRLHLALLAVQGRNLLLLDEPLNHLDIPGRESFERALARFEGTVLAVVHDRYFVERLATAVWELADGRLRLVESL